MTLSALIKKGGLSRAATATPATIATQKTDEAMTVAPVATVAVAVKPEPLPELSLDEETSIRVWLTHIEETNPAIIAEVLDKCRDDLDTRRYFLKRAEEVPEPAIIDEQIICGDCAHFESMEHPHLGHCRRGEPEAIAGLWDTSHRFCKSYMPLIDQQGDHNAND